MGSHRMIVTLPDEDKAWIESYSKAHNISAAEAIRQGIRTLRLGVAKNTYQTLIESTRGMWQKGDGMIYQDNIRSEWHSR